MAAVAGVATAAIVPLPPGSLIGIVAPAGPAEPSRVQRLEALYARHGYRCRVYPGCHLSTGYLAGPDDARLADLHAALADDDVAAIHALRGGYGCMRILDAIDAGLVARSRKLLIGYSDLTALHALWTRAGVPGLHAPMPASDLLLPGREADADALFALLRAGLRAGDVLAPPLDNDGLRVPGTAEGLLVGGNLSLVAALLGTPWAWPGPGSILFIEDVNEDLYRVDRLMTQLRLSGLLEQVAGLVLGSWTEAASPQALLRDMLVPLCERRGIPLLGGWPAGHGTPNRPLPLGVRVRLDATAGTLTMLQDLLPAAPVPPSAA